MASCTQIVNKIQAYVDGELSPAERVICDQHFAECPACSKSLRSAQRLSALLFEAFSEHRLSQSLSQRVVDHLPDIGGESLDLEGVNWRAKHPLELQSRLAKLVPLAAAALLLILGVLIKNEWPTKAPSESVIGVVLNATGDNTFVRSAKTQRETVALEEFVEGQQYFETSVAGKLMIALVGNTFVKMNENSRMLIEDERRVRLEKGEIWLDVGRDPRLFRVSTPEGNVTVFGTAFNVEVSENALTVTVSRGDVQVEDKEGRFQPLQIGQQVRIIPGQGPTKPVPVSVETVTEWSESIKPNERAARVFEEYITQRTDQSELAAKAVYMVDISEARNRGIRAIRLDWEPVSGGSTYCSYDIYVYDDKLRPLFKLPLDQSVFIAGDNASVQIDVPGDPIRNVDILSIRLVPRHETGITEAKITKVFAVPL